MNTAAPSSGMNGFPGSFGGGYANPYGNGYGGMGNSSGNGYGGSGMRTVGYGNGQGMNRENAAERLQQMFLDASGVPNYCGRLEWPLALRVLSGREPETHRAQIDALFQAAALQASAGRINPALLQYLGEAVEDLQAVLQEHKRDRFTLSLACYEESERFLRKLRKAPDVLAALAPDAGGNAREIYAPLQKEAPSGGQAQNGHQGYGRPQQGGSQGNGQSAGGNGSGKSSGNQAGGRSTNGGQQPRPSGNNSAPTGSGYR